MIQFTNTKDGKCMSVRFFRNGFDAVYKKRFLFIQFGKGTIKWVFIGKEPPRFLKQVSWKTRFESSILFFGTTKRPLPIGSFYAKANRAHERKGQGDVSPRSYIESRNGA